MIVGLLMILYKKVCDLRPSDLPSSVNQSVIFFLTNIIFITIRPLAGPLISFFFLELTPFSLCRLLEN